MASTPPRPLSPIPAPADLKQLGGDGEVCGIDDAREPEVCGIDEAPVCGGGDGWESLSGAEQGAWHGFLQANAEIQVELEHELQAAHHLSFSDYFALLALARAPEGKLRMHDLAKPVRLTRSGLTRLVERLERIGLIERAPCEDDARGTEARITDAGRELVLAASATHLSGVRRRFLSRFSPEELRVLAEQFGRLTA